MFLEAVGRNADMEVCVLPVFRSDPVARRKFVKTYRAKLLPALDEFTVNTQFSLISRLNDPQARLEAFERFSRPSISAPLSAPLEVALCQLVDGGQFDLIHGSRSYCAPSAIHIAEYLERQTGRRPIMTLDLDEDDSEFQSRLAVNLTRQIAPLAAKWARLECAAFHRLIQSITPDFDRIWTASEWESRRFRQKFSVLPATASNSAIINMKVKPHASQAKILFVGSLEHSPNAEGIKWFLRHVWPLLPAGSATLDIIGKSPPAWLVRAGRQPGINVIGWIDDLAATYRSAKVGIAPLQSGGGTRIKLLEYAANDLPIVSTPIGTEGLGFVHGRDILIAASPAQFATAIMSSLRDGTNAQRRARNAHLFVARHHNRMTIIAGLARCFDEMLTHRLTAHGVSTREG